MNPSRFARPLPIGAALLALIVCGGQVSSPPLYGQEDDKGPRLGRYNVEFRNSFLTYFELLPGGKYKVYNVADSSLLGQGEYSFDAKEKRVRWLSGRHKDVGYGGTFVVENNGKKHIIIMGRVSRAINEKK